MKAQTWLQSLDSGILVALGMLKYSGKLTSQFGVDRADQMPCDKVYSSVHLWESLGLNKPYHLGARRQRCHVVDKG